MASQNGPQPEITWQDGHGTTIADNWTVREDYDSRIPFWNATIDLNVPYNGTLDFMEFTCTVRQNGTDTEISVLYNVSLLVLELEIDEPDRIVAGQDVNVTCRLKLVSSYLEDFRVDWDIRSLPRSKVQMRESTRGEELVNELTIRHMAVEDLYEKTIVCEATGPADSDSVRAEWKPTGILDVVQNKGLRRSALATLDYKLPELDTGELHSDKLSSRWAFHSGRIQFFDPSYYWAFKVYAACVGSILLFVMVMFGAFTYLRRVNEHCYCC
nr:hypothetical protein BaRGS_008695 [Batillaria attramentaria]